MASRRLTVMKITCPNASCGQHLSGPRALMGSRFTCPGCDHSFIWTDCFHAGDAFVIYDLETTGLYPESDEFIQIAAVRLRAGCICPEESFFSFARPRQRISQFITSYTGKRVENAVTARPGFFNIGRLEGMTDPLGNPLVGAYREMKPPGAVVIPKVMVGFVAGDTNSETEHGGFGREHGHGGLWHRHSGVGFGLPLPPGNPGTRVRSRQITRVDDSLRITPALSSQRA